MKKVIEKRKKVLAEKAKSHPVRIEMLKMMPCKKSDIKAKFPHQMRHLTILKRACLILESDGLIFKVD